MRSSAWASTTFSPKIYLWVLYRGVGFCKCEGKHGVSLIRNGWDQRSPKKRQLKVAETETVCSTTSMPANAWNTDKLMRRNERRSGACHYLILLMVFTVTSSDCKVKKVRFYEFLFTLGWRLVGNTSLYKFPAPKHVSFRKYSSLNFRVFTVRDTKRGMLSPWKKVSPLDFQQFNHFKY